MRLKELTNFMIMKKLIYLTSIFTLLICCNQIKTETIIIDKDSEELVYLIELSTKDIRLLMLKFTHLYRIY